MIRCMANNYSTMGFWRSWHRSYNLWIVRYITYRLLISPPFSFSFISFLLQLHSHSPWWFKKLFGVGGPHFLICCSMAWFDVPASGMGLACQPLPCSRSDSTIFPSSRKGVKFHRFSWKLSCLTTRSLAANHGTDMPALLEVSSMFWWWWPQTLLDL